MSLCTVKTIHLHKSLWVDRIRHEMEIIKSWLQKSGSTLNRSPHDPCSPFHYISCFISSWNIVWAVSILLKGVENWVGRQEREGGLARAKAGNPKAAWTMFLHSSTKTVLCTKPPPPSIRPLVTIYCHSTRQDHHYYHRHHYGKKQPKPLSHTHTQTYVHRTLTGSYSAWLRAVEWGSKAWGSPHLSLKSHCG